jgi:hypothetical protein
MLLLVLLRPILPPCCSVLHAIFIPLNWPFSHRLDTRHLLLRRNRLRTPVRRIQFGPLLLQIQRVVPLRLVRVHHCQEDQRDEARDESEPESRVGVASRVVYDGTRDERSNECCCLAESVVQSEEYVHLRRGRHFRHHSLTIGEPARGQDPDAGLVEPEFPAGSKGALLVSAADPVKNIVNIHTHDGIQSCLSRSQ